MIKKIIVSFLMAVFIFCGICIGTTIVFAEDNTGNTAAVSNASKAQIASVSPFGLYPNGSDANVPIKVMEDDDEICTLMINPGLTFVNGYSTSFSCLRISKGSTVKIVPNKSVSIKKIIVQAQSTYTAGIAVDEKYGQLVDLTDDEKTQLNNPSTLSVKSIELNSEYVATEENPYVFTTSMQFYLQSIHVIYEKLPITETVPTNVTTYTSVETGGATISIGSTGYRGPSSVVINTRDEFIINPKPGFVIISITFDAKTEGAAFSVTPENHLTLTNKGSNANSRNDWELTGFQPGQSYILKSTSSYYQMYNATVAYIEHEHAEGELVLEYDNTSHWYKCTVCNGTNIDLQAHDFVDGEITKQPSNGLPGEQSQTCQGCPAEVIKYLPCPISDPAIIVESAGQLGYNGQPQAQKVIIKVGDVELVEGVDYTLSNNGVIDIGDYTLTITGIGKYSGTREFDFSIEKGRIAFPDPGQTKFPYNGKTQYYNLPTSAYYTISGSKSGTIRNTYTVTLKLADKTHYQWEDGTTTDKSYKWEIVYGIVPIPAEDPTVYKFTTQSYKYQIERNDELYNITYATGRAAEVYPGEYKITVTLKDKTNYKWEDGTTRDLTYTHVILEGEFDMSEVVFEDKEVVYDGTEHSLEATNLPDGVAVSYTYQQNGQTLSGLPTARGEYLVTANFEPADSFYASYYKTIEPMTATLKITKGKVVAPTADNTEFVYNGQPQTYNLATNDLLYTISGDDLTQTNAGTYTIILSLKNPEDCQWDTTGLSEDITYTFIIAKATYDMSGVVFNGNTVTYDGSTYSLEATNLPNGVSVTYENNDKTDAGVYTVIAKFTGDVNYNDIPNKTATLTIEKATYDMSAVVFADKTVTYNGSAQSILATNLPDGVTASYENNDMTDVGEYTVTVNFVGSTNYNDIPSDTAKLIITKATYDMSAVVFEDKTVAYNGSAQSILATNLPNGITATYQGNEQIIVGEYTITVNFVGNANYNDIPSQTATLTIIKGTYDMSGVVFADKTVVYNGTAFSIEATNLPSGVSVTYVGNGNTVVGEYTITAKFTGNEYYNAIADMTATLTIEKATYDMSAVVFADKTVTYNGSAFSIEATNLPTGVTASYENNGKTNAGEYVVTAIFTGNGNYNEIPNKTATLTINKATYDMSGVVFADKTVTYNGTAFSIEATNLPSGVTASYENNGKTEAGVYVVTAIFTGNANYNAIANKTATLTIEQVVVTVPTADSTAFTYNGQAQTYALQENSHYTISDITFTNAGNHTITVSLVDKTNYKWDNGNSNDLTYSFVIAKATYDMDEVVFTDKTVTYNGNAFSIEATNLPDGVTVAYENNGKTEAGVYTIIAKFTGKENYNAISDMTATLTINKATYNMSIVVFADKTVTYNGTAFSIEATNLPNGVTVAYENNGKTDAGVYTITAKFTGNANYNAIADMTATLTINKATYDMSGVVFADKTVTYNGTAFSIEATNLPNGVTVAYENNGKTDAGVYTITAKFTGNANYNAIADMTATLTIKNVLLTFNTDSENEIADEVIIFAPDGIDPTKELVVEEVEDTKNYSELINKNQKVAIAYDVKLLKDGATVQPDGTLQFKVLIPEELRGKDFSIIHIHNDDETSVLEYHIDGDYVVFESNKLSDFVFVYEMGSILWAIIVLSVVALFEVAFLVYLLTKNKQFKSKKLMSAYPPFLFGMFIAEWEIVLVIVLAVVVIALAMVSIIFATKVINNQTKTSAKAEEVAVEEESNDDQPIEEVKNEVDEKDEPVRKSFLERLGSCSPETIEYYNDIKNELLSYKNVKSKISFKHESFRLGMPIIARLKIRKKSLYLCLALDPKQYLDTKYKIKDMSAVGNYKDVPTMYKINLPRRAVYAKEMIQDLMGKFNAEKNND